MFRTLALVALLAAPAVAGHPTATGSVAVLPAGAQAQGVSGSFVMPVAEREAPEPAPRHHNPAKTGHDLPCP